MARNEVTMLLTQKTLMKGSDLLSMADLSKIDIEEILTLAELLKKQPDPTLLSGALLATCFFEPSTRTRLSFEAAAIRSGGSYIGFADGSVTSSKKGETLADSIRVISSYADLIVIRHPLEGSARLAAAMSPIPVINGGDGAGQHPTQSLLDLFSIKECLGQIDNLQIAIAGDLKFSRTVHSLCLALSHYAVRLYFVSPDTLPLPEEIQCALRKKGIKFSFHQTLDEILPKVDLLYMTRIQKERFPPSFDLAANPCVLKSEQLGIVKPTFRILLPFPRVDEIDPAIDNTPYAYYFQQAANGICVRTAIMALLLGRR